MSVPEFDIIVIGYGPVGQTFAGLAGKFGCRIAIFDRHSSLYGLPRAGHVDHETMRIFQALGYAHTIERNALRANKYEWRNKDGQVLIEFEWDADGVSGWPSDYMIFQPDIEDALDEAVRSTPTVSVNLGWEAIRIEQDQDHVQLSVCDSSNPEAVRQITARYLIAADGGNSFTRKALGLEWKDLGFSQPWLVADYKEKHPLSLPFENGQVCDPGRPMCLFQLGKSHRRFSFMVMPGEEEWAQRPETAWSLVAPWVGPDDVEPVRQATYVFESKLLDEWRFGRIFFAGDSAHVMPPFMGQGMCSGIRDAANLAWKMTSVLSGASSDELLDSYCRERKPHVADYIRLSMEVGRISCTTDREAARKRDEALLGGAKPPEPPLPGLVDGIIMSSPNKAEAPLVGRLGPQGIIVQADRKARADDILGGGWHLISAHDVSRTLSAEAKAVLKTLHAKTIHFDDAGAVDVDGVYRKYFEKNEVAAVLVRPDFYVYCAAETPERLNNSIIELHGKLGLHPVPEALSAI